MCLWAHLHVCAIHIWHTYTQHTKGADRNQDLDIGTLVNCAYVDWWCLLLKAYPGPGTHYYSHFRWEDWTSIGSHHFLGIQSTAQVCWASVFFIDWLPSRFEVWSCCPLAVGTFSLWSCPWGSSRHPRPLSPTISCSLSCWVGSCNTYLAGILVPRTGEENI